MKVKSKTDVVNRCHEWDMAIKEAEQKGRKIGIKEGRKEGRKIGRKLGRKEGIKKWITKEKERGKKEEKFETAKRLLNNHYSLDQVQMITQLTLEEINL
ncbi:MAG: hypothetical protein IJU79_05520, partial [Desulfovibrionaceae bacterium]|nr:hypothetical protein [Desulfovibrionaceae bacterium]